MSGLTLPGTVQKAQTGMNGFDIDSPLTAELCQGFINNGYSFCLRYLSLLSVQSTNDLSYSEATAIINSGLALMAVQHVMEPGWSPSASRGTEFGSNAANNATSVGLPPGINLWLDLEGVASGTASQDIIDYCESWYQAVLGAGFIPGLYVGYNCLLTGIQLFDLPFQHYWQSNSEVPAIPNRGYQMKQLASITVNNSSIDPDVTQVDELGGTVLWLQNTAG